MGERGPKPSIIKNLEPARRSELDEAIIDGRRTKQELFETYGKEIGVTYRAFCTYAARLEATAKHRYVGKLITSVFGNISDGAIDQRARGIMVAMLDRVAADVLHNGDLKPEDLRDIVTSYDLIRRGAIIEAQEKRRQTEYELLRMAGVAEAATWIKNELQAEIGNDPELLRRLNQAVDRYCAGLANKPEGGRENAMLLKSLSKKFNWKKDVLVMVDRIFGVVMSSVDTEPKVTQAQLVSQLDDICSGMDVSGVPRGKPSVPAVNPSKGDVCEFIDDYMRGKVDGNGQPIDLAVPDSNKELPETR